MELVDGAKAETLRNADITAAVIRRTSRQLLVRVNYLDLDRHAPRDWHVTFNVSTSGGSGTSYHVVWERARWGDRGRVGGKVVHADDWYQGVHVVAETAEDVFDLCRYGTSGVVDYRRNAVTIRVASRCLNDNPTWMRVEDLQSGRGGYTDNPFNSDRRSESTPPLFAPSP